MLKIWGRANSINVQKVMWAVGELALPHERIDAGGPFGGLDTEEFGDLNPNRRVPVIDDGGIIVWESHAIVRYLAAKHGAGSLWPNDHGARARSDMWMEWTSTDLQPAFIGGVFWNFYRTPEEKRNWPLIRSGIARSAILFRMLDNRLAGRTFIGGDALTIGDIAAGAQCYRYFNLEIDRPDIPHVEAWYARLQERPAYREHVMIPFDDLKGRLAF
ncbi:MAG: glutathione S-transferase family protein [Alphaproteobacteria bacterium]|nr:glutathione S-transferase family protein [Alphaproteobacteria bacterium]MBV9905839.1 glutathione S-transferase family protein [Alphaproteobacteria bacterium]